MAVLKVNLKKIKNNVKNIKNSVFCVVKANSYGVGEEQVIKTLNSVSAGFCVANFEEFERVKKFTDKDVIILSFNPVLAKQYAETNAIVAISSIKELKLITKFAKKSLEICLASNTGMNRIGVTDLQELEDMLKFLRFNNLKLKYFISHIFDYENKQQFNLQILRFNEQRNLVKKYFTDCLFSIQASSTCNLNLGYDFVRVGIGIYGDFSCFTLSAKIILIRKVCKGEFVGYGSKCVLEKNSIIAVVNIGYADGIPRRYVNSFVLVNGVRCKILAICMDMILIDVEKAKAKVLDDVILIGKSGKESVSLTDFASYCDTIPYEILCGFSSRIKRKYI